MSFKTGSSSYLMIPLHRLLTGSFRPDNFFAIPSYSVSVKILHVAHYIICFMKSKEMRA